MRPLSSSTQLLLCHCFPMQTFYQKCHLPIRPICSFSKKCSSSNILSVTPQPALTLLVHSETTFSQQCSYHTTGEIFQEVSCSKVNWLTVLWFTLNHLKNNKNMLSGPSLFSEILLGTILCNRSVYGSPTSLHIQA